MLVSVLLKLSGTMHEMKHGAHEEHEHWGHGLHLFLTNPEALASFVAVAVHALAMFAVALGNSPQLADKLGASIVDGTKTATTRRSGSTGPKVPPCPRLA